jgi:hypothetical protein
MKLVYTAKQVVVWQFEVEGPSAEAIEKEVNRMYVEERDHDSCDLIDTIRMGEQIEYWIECPFLAKSQPGK